LEGLYENQIWKRYYVISVAISGSPGPRDRGPTPNCDSGRLVIFKRSGPKFY
jgi:hypothetical protein